MKKTKTRKTGLTPADKRISFILHYTKRDGWAASAVLTLSEAQIAISRLLVFFPSDFGAAAFNDMLNEFEKTVVLEKKTP